MTELILKTPSSSCKILIGQGLLKKAGQLSAPIIKGRTAAVVTDENVGPLHADSLREGLEAAGFAVKVITLPAGEEHKRLSTVARLYDFFLDSGLTRSDAVFALGGGVVGDMAGYAAATYMRGIPVVQVPTTLLAQVDSSIGGKTGVDLPRGKNLVGAFHQPRLVISDIDTLRTLPEPVFKDGMAEVLKYGFIWDEALLRETENGSVNSIEAVVSRCAAIKAKVVSQDELDTGLRNLLNFGHTLGHAMEKLGDFTAYSHGQAVAAGMVLACHIGEHLGTTPAGTAERAASAARSWGLPDSVPYGAKKLFEAAMSDKKKSGHSLTLVLLRRPGEATLHPIPAADLLGLLERCL